MKRKILYSVKRHHGKSFLDQEIKLREKKQVGLTSHTKNYHFHTILDTTSASPNCSSLSVRKQL